MSQGVNFYSKFEDFLLFEFWGKLFDLTTDFLFGADSWVHGNDWVMTFLVR